MSDTIMDFLKTCQTNIVENALKTGIFTLYGEFWKSFLCSCMNLVHEQHGQTWSG